MIKRFGRLSVGALLAALLFSHLSVAKAGDIISNRLVEIIENKNEGEKVGAYKYLSGVAHGISWTNGIAGVRGSKPLFCPPANWNLGLGEIYKTWKTSLDDRPDLDGGSKPVAVTLLAAFMWKYPCKQGHTQVK